jgi:hypothetical protein
VILTTDPDKQLRIRNAESCLFRGSVKAFFKHRHSLCLAKRLNLVFDSFITSRVCSFRRKGCNPRWGNCVLFHRNKRFYTSFMKGVRLLQVFVRIGRQYHAARQNFMSYPQYLLYLMAIKTSGHRITTTPPFTYKIDCLYKAFFKHSLRFVKGLNLVFDSFITSRVCSFRREGYTPRWGNCVQFHRNTHFYTSFMKGGRLIQVYRH